MIDVHILTRPEQNNVWFAECLDSLKDEPVVLHILQGVKDHVGLGRIQGYSQGSCEWVSFVDPDDVVVPGIFNKVLEAIATHEGDAVFTQEMQVNADLEQLYPVRGCDPHHLMVFRRSLLMPLLDVLKDFPINGDRYLATEFIKKHRATPLYEVGYKWRIHESNWHKRYRSLQNVVV